MAELLRTVLTPSGRIEVGDSSPEEDATRLETIADTLTVARGGPHITHAWRSDAVYDLKAIANRIRDIP